MGSENSKKIINNEFDYSNCLPTIECVTYLIQYIFNVYDNFLKLQTEDEEKNKPLKVEYKEWKYKKSYGEKFEVYIREKTYNNIICKDFVSFQSAVNEGNLKNVLGLTIRLNLDYKRGTGENLDEYENSFYISFEPNNVIFARKSNHIEEDINQIETNIKTILEKFPTINTIFCTK